MRLMPVAERLQRNSVDGPNGCRIWTGDNVKGYGRLQIRRKNYLAHRVAYECHVGPIPEGHDVLHRCDNPSCINPAHLFTGTHADNMRDKVRKGRHVPVRMPGEKHPMVKLTDKQVLDIRTSGLSSGILAHRYGVSARHIRKIIAGSTRNA